MEKEIKTNPFDLYQVVAKCSDGDVLISKDGKQAFTYSEAKAIEAEHQGLGAEVLVEQVDRNIITNSVSETLSINHNCPIYWKDNFETKITDKSIEVIADERYHWMIETYNNGDKYHAEMFIDDNYCMHYADLVFAQCVFDILEEIFGIEIDNK